MDSVKNLALSFKEQLISGDATSKQNAVLGINECLGIMNNESVAKIILDLDIHTLLLNHLIKSNCSANPDILKCIEHLCSYKIYFTQDHAVFTAEIILKNIFTLIKSNIFDRVLLESLKIITKIIENLNDYYYKNNLTYHCYLDTIRNLLTHKKNVEIISTTIKMLSALLLNEKFQKYINNYVLNTIEELWMLALEKLEEIFNTDARSSVIAACKLCDSILRMFSKIRAYKQEKIEVLYEKVQTHCINILNNVCIPFFAEFGLQYEICVEYLCFLEIFLKTISSKDILNTISKKLVFDLNFTVISKYLEKSTTTDIQDKNNVKTLCLMILCEIIVNLQDVSSFSSSENKCKKYLFQSLQTLQSYNINEWLIFLRNAKNDMNTKLSIIIFCTMYYVYSYNLPEIQPEHLYSYIEFLQRFPTNVDINICYLQNMWLLFAAIYCANYPHIPIDSALYKATSTLERLISFHEKSFDKLLIFHPYIIFWLYMNPYIKKDLIFAVTNRWLLQSATDPPTRAVLLSVISKHPKAASQLLTTLQRGSAAHSAAAADLLRAGLQQGPLASCPEFVQELSVAVPRSFMKLNEKNVARDQVVQCIYMLHLSSFITTSADRDLLAYSVQSFTHCFGSLNVAKHIPPVFYTNAFDYVYRLLQVAKTNRIQKVYTSLMNSEPVLYTMMGALVSDDQKMSYKAGQIFNHLLDYQNYSKLYCKNTIVIKKEFLVKLLSVEDTEQLELNLQILKTQLFKTAKSVLDLEIDDHILTGLYFRCLNLVSKPCERNFSKIALKCMEGLLRYTQIHNNIEVQDYMCHHSGNHIMILTFFDKETSRQIEREFLSFILCWLQLAANKKDKILSQLSINYNFWKISIYQIADLLLNENVDSKLDNVDLTNGILRQLFKLSEMLPVPIANYLKTIEENLN